MSIVGAYQFAEVVVVRMLALICNNQLDLTRPIVEQLIALLALTVVSGHVKPTGATSNILFQTSPMISVVIPSSIETSAFFSHILTEYKNYFLKNSISPNQTVPNNWQEAEIIIRSGWRMKSTDQHWIKMAFPKFVAAEELGDKYASPLMFTLLKEIGWSLPKDDFLSYDQASTSSHSSKDKSSSGNDAPVNGELLSSLQSQIQTQQAQIQSLQQTITQLNQAVSYYGQLLPSEQQARLLLTQQLAQLSAKVQSITNSPTPNFFTSYSSNQPTTPNYPAPPQPFAPSLLSRSNERIPPSSLSHSGHSQNSETSSESSADAGQATLDRINNSTLFQPEKIEESEEYSDETSSTASVTE